HVVNFGAATTITLTGSFPSINVPLTINGRNSAGQRVEINGNGFGGGSTIFGGLLAFEQASGGSMVRSLVLNNSGTGIYLGTAGNSVQDCYLGTDTTGTLAHANYQGLVVTGPSNQIGGETAADRNVISGNTIGVAYFG